MRFVPPLSLLLAALSLCAACVPQHRPAVPGARLSVGPESFADDGPFRIAFAGPKGEIATPREVTIAFSRAMHRLAMVDDTPSSAPPPATVVRAHVGSAVEGIWRWFGERTAVFWPSGGFRSATVPAVSWSSSALRCPIAPTRSTVSSSSWRRVGRSPFWRRPLKYGNNGVEYSAPYTGGSPHDRAHRSKVGGPREKANSRRP